MRRMSVSIALVLILASTASAAPPKTDPLSDLQWGLERIGAPEVWTASQGKGVVVAVVDTGVELNHPDLKRNLAGRGIDLAGEAETSGAHDENGHGTHVAGIIAAVRNNGIGVVGVAPRARILPVRVCDSEGLCEDTDIAEGIRYAADGGADVINLSVSLALVRPKIEGGEQAILDAITYAEEAGAVVIAAAGNLSLPICQQPAAAVLCVGSIGPDDSKALYSNHDVTTTSRYIVAPGGGDGGCEEQIVSTYLSVATDAPCGLGKGFASMTGTSMAAPFVSGVAALLSAEGLSSTEIVDRILATTEDLGVPGRDPLYGEGLLDARAALAEEDP